MSQPLNVRIAADARAGQTDYTDDQSWELALGRSPDEPAFTLQTRYGGRVGLARLVPMLNINNRSIYEAGAFAGHTQLTAFAPDALRLETEPVPGLKLAFFAWVLDSHTLCGRFMLTNNTDSEMQVGVQVFAQAMRENKSIRMSLLHLDTPDGDVVAIAMGQIGNLQPVLMMEQAQETGTAKLHTPLALPAGGEGMVRFVHAGLPNLNDSLMAAYRGLYQTDWTEHINAISARAARLPLIDTGDAELDAAIGFSQQTLLRSLLAPTSYLPFDFPVFARIPSLGYASDTMRAWAGLSALDTFQFAASLAPLEPTLAQGIVKNYLARQKGSGWIDGAPGGAGQKADFLLLPMLAQLTEIIFTYSRDTQFVKDVFPGLVKFYAYWFAQDSDGDGFPEWQSAAQTNFEGHPLFSLTPYGGSQVDVTLVESPDLASYLLNEGDALARLAKIGGQPPAWKKAAGFHEKLAAALMKSWRDGRFYYRDRDFDAPLVGETLFKGKGDQSMMTPAALKRPNRVVIHVEGGVSHRPTLRGTITGTDSKNKPVTEVIENEAFDWYRSQGSATSRTIWSQVDGVKVEGLSRVYEFSVRTVDMTRHDITLLLPYTTSVLTQPQVEALSNHLEAAYWQDYGLSTLPKDDPNPEGQRVVMPWATMLGLAMLKRGESRASGELFMQITAVQVKSLIQQGSFFQWYGAEGGLGMADHTSGLIPLHWLMQLIGLTVRDGGTVEIFAPMALKRGVKLLWHGVRIARTNRSLKIKFPSGHHVELPADAPPQIITDPDYQPAKPNQPEPPKSSKSVKLPVSRRVEVDDDLLWGEVD